MRLLLVADLHYSLPQFDWVLEMAPDFDVVVMAGDHLDLASIVDGRAQSVVVRKYFGRLRAKTRLVICSGNHDLDAKNEAGEKFAKWLSGSQHEGVLSDGESIIIDGTLFTACPWWDGPIVKAGIGAQLAEASDQRPERWIWIHHAPPAKSPTSWGGDRYFGDVELREWIEQYRPDMVLSGHVHQSPFVKDGSAHFSTGYLLQDLRIAHRQRITESEVVRLVRLLGVETTQVQGRVSGVAVKRRYWRMEAKSLG